MANGGGVQVKTIYAVALLLAVGAIACAFVLSGDASIRALLAARYSARAAFLGFVVVYLAGPVARLWPESAVARRLRALGRHLGLAFAFLMLVHLVALAINVGLYRPRTLSGILSGAPIYALILAMALTSNDAAQRRMGEWWRRLHFLGLNATLFTFLTGYSARLFDAEYATIGVIFTPIVIALIAVRVYATMLRGRGAPPRRASAS